MNIVVKITPNEKGNPPGKLADAELHFIDGELDGLKLIGFAIWEATRWHVAATSRSRPASTPSMVNVAASRCCERLPIGAPRSASASSCSSGTRSKNRGATSSCAMEVTR